MRGFPEIKCFPSGLNLGLPRQGLFSFHWTTEALKYEVPCPPPRPSQLRWSFRQYFGVKIMYRCDFLFISSYPSLLISWVHTRQAVRGWGVNIFRRRQILDWPLQYNLSTIKYIELGPPTSRAIVFPLDHRGCEIWGPLPPDPISASLILPAIFWGQNYVPVRPYALIFSVFPFSFSFWIFSFCYSLLILLFLTLLSLLVGAILRFLILLLLYFKLFVVLHVNDLHISVILRGFSKGPSLFEPFVVRPYVLTFFCFIFYSSLHISPYYFLLHYILPLLIFKLFVVLQSCILNTHWVKVYK